MHFLAHGDQLGVAVAVLPPDHGRKVVGRVVLDYDARCLRRKRLATEGGAAFLVDLPRLAWHIGNRHCPCEMAEDHLVIRADPVLEDMLLKLGAKVEKGFAPFRPEGGAYGHGRTFGHGH